MVRILTILVGLSVVINALTFLTVAHYFTTEKPEKPAATQGGRTTAADTASTQLLDRFSRLESSLGSLQKKIDGLAARSASRPPPAPQRSSVVQRLGAGRRPTAGGASPEPRQDGADEAEAAEHPNPQASARAGTPGVGGTPQPAGESNGGNGPDAARPEGSQPPAEGNPAPGEGTGETKAPAEGEKAPAEGGEEGESS